MVVAAAPQTIQSASIVEAVFHRDIFCAKCHLMAARLEDALRRLGPCLRWRIRPYPSTSLSHSPKPQEIEHVVRLIERLRREPDAPTMSANLWTGELPPGPRLEAMAAVEAASFQGPRYGRLMDHRLRLAIFEMGLDANRREVLMDVAGQLSSLGLDLARFEKDLLGATEEQWKDRILDRRNEAVCQGVKEAPALVLEQKVLPGVFKTSFLMEEILDSLVASIKEGSRVPAA